jgi:hypothetical protein
MIFSSGLFCLLSIVVIIRRSLSFLMSVKQKSIELDRRDRY